MLRFFSKSHLFLFYVNEGFTYMYVLHNVCITSCVIPVPAEDRRGCLDSLEPALEMTVSNHMNAGNQTQILCKSITFS